MVPVLDQNKIPLMPCSEKRARKLLESKQARRYWKQGVFCIILQRNPKSKHYQDILVGIDPGSKREAYTVATKKRVVLNLLTNTPDHVKSRIETRRNIRRSRRYRKTPYRRCRYNRKIGGIPPSTKARWQAKLRILNFLKKILPITDVNIEDIQAKSKEGKRKWNQSFSPLEVGKSWFYQEIKNIGLGLCLTEGYKTFEYRNKRGFIKTSKKLEDSWEAHNVDSHVLCEKYFGREIEPFKGIYRLNFFRFHRRQLHVIVPIKGGVRKQYGSTTSMGLARGCLVTHPKYGKTYIGGTSNNRISLHEIPTGKRLARNIKKEDIKILNNLKWLRDG